MISAEIKIRTATVDDAEQLATLFMRAWHINLKEFAPDGFLDQFSHEKQREKYVQRTSDPELIFFVAECQGKIIGMIYGIDHHLEPRRYQKEIRALYVDPDFQRQGIGALLLGRMLSELKREQAESVMLWCIKANEAACSFYEKHGGKRVEGIKPPEEYSAMSHVVYVWEFNH